MFEGTKELAESKLLLLYILNRIEHPISNSLMTEIILENNLLNYFHLQQYLGELVDSGFIDFNKEEKKQIYSLSNKGKDVLEYFESRISDTKKNIVDSYLYNHKGIIDKSVDITASYFLNNDDGYTVECRLSEGSTCLIDIRLNANSGDDAVQLCTNWKKNATGIYNKIIKVFNE